MSGRIEVVCTACGKTFLRPASRVEGVAKPVCSPECRAVVNRGRRGSTWDSERLASLTKLWNDGWSAGQIAKRFGVTRNAVIGQVNRHGLSGRGRPTKPTLRAPAVARQTYARPPKPGPQNKPAVVFGKTRPARTKISARGVLYTMPPDRPTPEARRAAFSVITPSARPWEERRAGQCCWPIDTPNGVYSCCAPVTGEGRLSKGYCATHARIGVTVPKSDAEELARSLRRFG